MLGNINVLTQENVEKLMDVRTKFGIDKSYPDCVVRPNNSCKNESDLSLKNKSDYNNNNRDELINEVTKMVLNEMHKEVY
jgi:hypothetical protein